MAAPQDDDAGSVDENVQVGKGFSAPEPPVAVLEMAQHRKSRKTLMSGYFTQYKREAAPGLIRITANGAQDPLFNVGDGLDGPATAIVPLRDGGAYIGGAFQTYDGQQFGNLIRIGRDGALDTDYQPAGFNDDISAMTLLPDGSLVVAGFFTLFGSQPVAGGLARLNPDGTLDSTFESPDGTPRGTIESLLTVGKNRVLVGGIFEDYGTTRVNGIARIRTDGTLDESFKTGRGFSPVSGTLGVYQFTKFRKGYLVGGAFSKYRSQKTGNLVLISKEGRPSKKFRAKSGFDGQVNSIAIQANNRVIAVGNFSNYRNKSAPGIVRLREDGLLDNSFQAGKGFNASVSESLLRSDGSLLVGGFFNRYDGQLSPALVGIQTK